MLFSTSSVQFHLGTGTLPRFSAKKQVKQETPDWLQQTDPVIQAKLEHLDALRKERPTRVSRWTQFKNRVSEIGRAWPFRKALIFLGALTVGLGVSGGGGYMVNRFHRTSVEDWHVGRSINTTNDWVRETTQKKTSYNYSLQHLIDFQDKYRTFLDSIKTVLSESNQAEHQAIAARIEFNTGVLDAKVNSVGTELLKQAAQRRDAGKSLDVRAFIDSNPAFKHLSERDKEMFSVELYTVLNNHPDMTVEKFLQERPTEQKDSKKTSSNQTQSTYESNLRKVLSVALGNKIAGVTLDDYLRVDSKESAIAMFERVANHPDNLSHLSPTERQEYVQAAKTVLENVHYGESVPGYGYMALAYALLVTGIAGSIATGASAVSSLKELRQGLSKKPQITRTPLTLEVIERPEDQPAIEAMYASVMEHCKTAVALRQSAMEKNPEVAVFLTHLAGGKTPKHDAQELYEAYKSQAHARFNQKGYHSISKLRLVKEVQTLAEQATNNHDFLPELAVLAPSDVVAPLRRPNSVSLDVRLNAEVQDRTTKLLEAQRDYINQLIWHTKQEADHEALVSQVTGLAEAAKGRETRELIRERRRKEMSEKLLGVNHNILAQLKHRIQVLEEQCFTCTTLLDEYRDNEEFRAKVAQHAKIRGVNEDQLNDEDLKELGLEITTRTAMDARVRKELEQQRRAREYEEQVLREARQKAGSTEADSTAEGASGS